MELWQYAVTNKFNSVSSKVSSARKKCDGNFYNKDANCTLVVKFYFGVSFPGRNFQWTTACSLVEDTVEKSKSLVHYWQPAPRRRPLQCLANPVNPPMSPRTKGRKTGTHHTRVIKTVEREGGTGKGEQPLGRVLMLITTCNSQGKCWLHAKTTTKHCGTKTHGIWHIHRSKCRWLQRQD